MANSTDKKIDAIIAGQSAPAVITEPAPMPKAEAEQKKAEAEAMPAWERKVEADAVDKRLAAIERTTGRSGASPRTPKQMMLDASDAKERNPDLHLRWVNVNNTDKVTTHVGNGYERLPESQGGRTLGNLVLMSIPKKLHEERKQEIKNQVRVWMAADKEQFESFLAGMAQALRDKYGLHVSPKQLGGIIRGE